MIIGVLAAFGVPRFIKSVEKSKASEAFEYLASVRTAQERYQAQYGTYATNVTDLDIKSPRPSTSLCRPPSPRAAETARRGPRGASRIAGR